MARSKLLLPLLLLPLVACQTVETPIETIVPFTTPSVPEPQPLVLGTVQWKVYNSETIKKLALDLNQHPDQNFIIFALTPKGYQSLSLNLVQIERYMKEQKQVVLFLKNTLDERERVAKKDAEQAP